MPQNAAKSSTKKPAVVIVAPSFFIFSRRTSSFVLALTLTIMMGSMPVRVLGRHFYHSNSCSCSQSRRRLTPAFIPGLERHVQQEPSTRRKHAFVATGMPSLALQAPFLSKHNMIMERLSVPPLPLERCSSSSRLFATEDGPKNQWNTNSTNPGQQQQQRPPGHPPLPKSTSNYNNSTRNSASSSQPQIQQRRPFSSSDSWTVPKSIDIPVERIDLSFVRASGSGGQNVNKVNTKVELRFDVMEADWLPLEVRERLCQQQRNRINKKGIFSLTSQEHRTQEQNRKSAVTRLHALLMEAWPRPVVRKLKTGISKATKAKRKEFKRRRSETKQSRKGVSDW